MASISSVASVGSNIGAKALGGLSKTKPVQKLCNWFRKDPEKAVAFTTIGSVVIKDGVGCVMYVYQSLNNKKIPDDKRKFVAALDLTNGILMIVSQIAMFFAMRKINDKLFGKIFKHSFDKAGKAFKAAAEEYRMDQKAAGAAISRKSTLKQEYNNIRKETVDIFKFITELAAATIIGKRVIVPFIATPLAKVVEKKMNSKDTDNKTAEQNAQPNSSTETKEPEIKQAQTNPFTAQTNNSTNLLAKYKK